MRREHLSAKMKKGFKKTKGNVSIKAAPNLLQQNFKSLEPNQKWVADITYIHTDEGWLYVAAILDLFSRRIVGLSMDNHSNTSLIINAVKQAILHRQPGKGLIHHSDKGCQYTSNFFKAFLDQYKIVISMNGIGNCYDNAVMESFFHTLKAEHVTFEKYKTREQAKKSIFEYIEVFYNRKRRHSAINYMTPVEFEERWLEKRGANSMCL